MYDSTGGFNITDILFIQLHVYIINLRLCLEEADDRSHLLFGDVSIHCG